MVGKLGEVVSLGEELRESERVGRQASPNPGWGEQSNENGSVGDEEIIKKRWMGERHPQTNGHGVITSGGNMNIRMGRKS